MSQVQALYLARYWARPPAAAAEKLLAAGNARGTEILASLGHDDEGRDLENLSPFIFGVVDHSVTLGR